MKQFWFATAAVLVFVSGCAPASKEASNSSTTDEKSAIKPFKVALLTPGPVNDSGWCALAYEGLQAIKTDLGAEVQNQVSTGNDIRDSMRAYANGGADLVIGHGFEYNEPGVEVAADFPNTVFVSSSGSKTAANAGAIRFYMEQGFYLAGMTAALTSKTGVIGMVGGPEVPSIKSTFKAFEAGAKAARADIVVQQAFTGKNEDVAAAKQIAETMIKRKADILVHQANAAAQGVFNACKEGGILAIGANLDQNSNDSGVVLGSAIIVSKPAFVEVALLVKDKKFNGQVIWLDMKKSAIDFVLNPALKSRVSDSTIKLVAQAKADIISGKLVVTKDNF